MALVEVNGIGKAFGATQALDDVHLSLDAGQVHGLLGENGAGKSTLMKVLAGAVRPDTGTVFIDGEELTFGKPEASRAAGVGIAFQELSSPLNVDIATKLCWPDLPRGPLGLVSSRHMVQKAKTILAHHDAADIDPHALIGEVNLATRQRVEIIAAVARNPKLLILDEPTAALPDTEWIFSLVRRAAELGTAVVYISHKLPEIDAICDQGTVLRNGRSVGHFRSGSFNEAELVELMIGRSFEQSFPPRQTGAVGRGQNVLSVENLMVRPRLHEATLHVDEGEIVGVAGLEGQGQRELIYAISGAIRPTRGDVTVTVGKASTTTALVPEERKTEALFNEMTTEFNLTLAALGSYSAGPLIQKSKERRVASSTATDVNLPATMLPKQVSTLSGGNQQKVVFGRALSSNPACLLLFDPTRGVDAATKFELYELIRGFANQGRGVLLYSTEIPELVGLCDRIYTISKGRIGKDLSGEEISEASVMSAALAWREDG